MHAIISIHDVMPETLSRVADIIDRLPAQCLANLLLLVVPGKDWQAADIAVLSDWQARGIELAGHGWQHEVRDIRTLYHRLHSLLISRRAAEHLSLSNAKIRQLMQDNHDWFVRKGLQAPAMYVPPAWAMGAVGSTDLAQSPFRYFETTSAIIDVRLGETALLPLVGFEADTWLRKLALTINNRLNRWLSSERRPLRISIHPYDPDYLVADALWELCDSVTVSRHYASVFEPA